MIIEKKIESYFVELDSTNESIRDLASEYLGDILEHETCGSEDLQLIIDKLAEHLVKESNSTVLESMLNALTNSVYSKHNLTLLNSAIKSIFPRLEGASIEHANYILKGT